MMNPTQTDILEIEARARAMRAAYARALVTALVARLRRRPVELAHA